MNRCPLVWTIAMLVACSHEKYCEEEAPYDAVFAIVDTCSRAYLCARAEVVVGGNVVTGMDEPGPYVDPAPSSCSFGFTPDIKAHGLDGYATAEKAGYQKATITWHLDQDECFRGKTFFIPMTPVGGCP